MYNKIVITLLVFAMLAGAGHAQYYTRSYSAPGGYAYGHSIAALDSSYASVSYFGQWQRPVLAAPAPRTPSYFNFAYAGNPIQAPTFQAVQYSPSSFNYQFAPNNFQPTYGSGPSFGNFNVNLAPHFTPSYGPSLDIGSINFAAGPRPIAYGNSLNFGPYNYAFRSYAAPIYATPSRALFNTEFHYASYLY